MALQAEKPTLKRTKQLIAFRVPGFDAGFVARARDGVRGAGDAHIQGRVRRGDREGRFDDIAGRGFMIIGRNGDPAAALSPGDRDYWSVAWRQHRADRRHRRPRCATTPTDNATALMDEYGCDIIVEAPGPLYLWRLPERASFPH